ncbi:unnamed protein product [Paramecium pentaurelia]|uniref:Ribonuclease n=1 Tax=Paramecium pentaurelia TaxID=43138 RepID=A0A8S1X9T8_9CILI|nr:unnamed protein product [Paramecium pentaurelia]
MNVNNNISIDELPQNLEDLKTNSEWILGIFEAGRGPLIGPIIIAGCFWPINNHNYIVKQCSLSLNKQFYQNQTESSEIISKLKGQALQFETIEISAQKLSTKILAYTPSDLNEISLNYTIQLIKNILSKGYKIIECYINPIGFKENLNELLKKGLGFENNDLKFIVGIHQTIIAAQIVAMQERNARLLQIQQDIYPSGQMGSGYPSDNQTREFLSKVSIPFFIYPEEIRFAWQTISASFKQKAISIEYMSEENWTKQTKEQFIENPSSLEYGGLHFENYYL